MLGLPLSSLYSVSRTYCASLLTNTTITAPKQLGVGLLPLSSQFRTASLGLRNETLLNNLHAEGRTVHSRSAKPGPELKNSLRLLSTESLSLNSYFSSASVMNDTSSRGVCSRGAFIVLEGIDRCGKSTQALRLVECLKSTGVHAELWSFPDRSTPTGVLISEYLTSKSDLDDAVIHLLFSANRWEKKNLLLQKLQAGTTLVVDRYAYSGVAFTAAKHLPGLDVDWCKGPDKGLPMPDAVLYFELSLEEAERRGGYGTERYEKRELQQEVKLQFESLRSEIWHTVDAAQTLEGVAEQVVATVLPVIEEARGKSLPKLLW